MKPILTENDKTDLEKKIAQTEKATGIQIVLATVRRSDSYIEIPWKAFALTASVAALIVLSVNILVPVWVNNVTLFVAILVIPGAAVIASMMSVLIPPFARLLLSDGRAEAETKQYAESMFLKRGLFSTAGRSGLLVLVSIFERKVVILPDRGISDRLNNNVLADIISAMKHPLRKGEMKLAMGTALDEIIRIMKPVHTGEDEKNELPDEIIEDKGV